MQYEGILIGFLAFVIIGVFHPVVIKAEYHFGTRIWPVFLLAGLVFLGISLFMRSVLLSAVFGVLGFTCLWSIHEIIEQAERVKKGWFPRNPKRSE